MTLIERKNQLIDEIMVIENENLIIDIEKLLHSQMKLNKFDFESEWEKALTVNEFRSEMHKSLEALPWKEQ